MRIGIVAGEFPPMPGGVGAYTAILARRLMRAGHEVCVLSTRGAASPDITVDDRLSNWGPGSLIAARSWAKEARLDLVNIQYQTSSFNMSPWIHFLPDILRPIPVVTTFHDRLAPYLFPKAGPLRSRIVNRLAQRSAGVITTNHEDRQHFETLARAVMIPIGSNILTPLPPTFESQQWRENHAIGHDDFLLVYFGLMNRSKGVDTLLRSVAALRECRVPVKLVIVGGGIGSTDPSNTRYKAEIDALIDQLDLTQHVFKTGYLDDSAVAAYLKAADAVVLPFRDGASFRRGSLMAAIHYGAVIVTTQPSIDIPEFIDHENMILVPPDNADRLAQTLQSLYRNPQPPLRQGAAQLAQRFDWDQIAQDSIALFKRITQTSA